MESSTIFLLSGAGIVVVGIGTYIVMKLKDPHKEFVKNEHMLKPLVKKLPAPISIQEWTGAIVSINNHKLTRWWKKMVASNGNNSSQLTASLISQLKKWNIDILWNLSFVPKQPVSRPYNLIYAKKAFVDNLPRFSVLLPTLHNGFSIEKWTEVIVDVNDYDLTEFWKKMAEQPNVTQKMLQVLSSWQIKSDTCKSFTCLTQDNILAYKLPDGGQLNMNQRYKVESPCWIRTIEDISGNISKEIIIKGIVTPKQKTEE